MPNSCHIEFLCLAIFIYSSGHERYTLYTTALHNASLSGKCKGLNGVRSFNEIQVMIHEWQANTVPNRPCNCLYFYTNKWNTGKTTSEECTNLTHCARRAWVTARQLHFYAGNRLEALENMFMFSGYFMLFSRNQRTKNCSLKIFHHI